MLEEVPEDFDGDLILSGSQARKSYNVIENMFNEMNLPMQIILLPDVNYLAWRGGTILAVAPSAHGVTFQRAEYEEVGPPGVMYKFIS
jgi:actin-related protein